MPAYGWSSAGWRTALTEYGRTACSISFDMKQSCSERAIQSAQRQGQHSGLHCTAMCFPCVQSSSCSAFSCRASLVAGKLRTSQHKRTSVAQSEHSSLRRRLLSGAVKFGHSLGFTAIHGEAVFEGRLVLESTCAVNVALEVQVNASPLLMDPTRMTGQHFGICSRQLAV